jgi:uncharacterized protein YutE (UPF0331/DUF86 family)
MVDPEVLASRIGKLRGYLEKLHILAAIPQQEFLHDFTKVESTKHLLQVSIECCLDIAHHIVASEGYRTPADSYDTFVVLHDNDILPADFMPRLRQMVRFRNRLVHMYWEVDDVTMYRVLQENLSDFETYIGHVLDFTQ